MAQKGFGVRVLAPAIYYGLVLACGERKDPPGKPAAFARVGEIADKLCTNRGTEGDEILLWFCPAIRGKTQENESRKRDFIDGFASSLIIDFSQCGR